MTEPYCSFQVGDKVVCVDDKPRGMWPDCELKRGEIYTVTRVNVSRCGALAVCVAEVVARGTTVGFYANRFRRVISTDNQITALKKIVADVFQKDGASV